MQPYILSFLHSIFGKLLSGFEGVFIKILSIFSKFCNFVQIELFYRQNLLSIFIWNIMIFKKS